MLDTVSSTLARELKIPHLVARFLVSRGVCNVVAASRILNEGDDADLSPWGIKGMEVYSPAQKGAVGRKYKEMAIRYGLVGTGGSDFHTESGAYPPGCMKMPYTVVQALKECREKSRAEWF